MNVTSSIKADYGKNLPKSRAEWRRKENVRVVE